MKNIIKRVLSKVKRGLKRVRNAWRVLINGGGCENCKECSCKK